MDLASEELLARTDVGFDGVVLALASGAAAVLSLTSGVASALVGVMVAVALLPPTATLGMMLATGQTELAAGYQPVMPTYQGILSESQIDGVIAYMQSLSEQNEGDSR